jgi:hypothetical protein
MPSDPRVAAALAVLQPTVQAIRTAIAATADEVREFLAGASTNGRGRAERFGAELGPFAAARIDPERFAALFADAINVDQQHIDAIRRGLEILDELIKRHTDLVIVRVPPGHGLVEEVDRALAQIGRAFAAARAVDQARAGWSVPGADVRDLESFPYRQWSRAERRLAPPLFVEVEGADLNVGGLAPFLDGGQKIVLAVGGETPPAPLVRLVTPGTLVLQTTDPQDLVRLLRWDGPAVAALVPETAAQFVHDPTAGHAPWERLTVARLPNPPRRAVGGFSAAQQAEELRQLEALAAKPAAAGIAAAEPAAAAGPVPPAAAASSPADKLAAWLLRQADLNDLA